ncbi:hypothetical protein [Streptomyces sp. NPDC094147]
MNDRADGGFSNCGLVVSDGQGLLVDTQFILPGNSAVAHGS